MDELFEKSRSRAQQALMGQAYAVKIGKLDPIDINKKYRKTIVGLADSMTLKELKKYAFTKHKGLPEYVDNNEISESKSNELGIVTKDNIPTYEPIGPCMLRPYLNVDAKKKVKGKKNMQNLKDYRDWLDSQK